jgi:hypothetical protein
MKKKLFLTIFFSLLIFFGFRATYAADVFCTSSKSSVVENETFTITVNTNTSGVYINSIEGSVSFPNDLLSVDSVSTSGSIFSIWVEQPTFSNTLGTISFNGGVPTPGFNGARGKVVSILFKAKKAGTAQISFSSANIYANDGMGTDVTSSKNGIVINITPYEGAKTTEEVMASDKLPPSPVITSSDMPDPESWYSLNKATFSWNLLSKITAVQILLDTSSNSIPNITYSPPIGEKIFTDLSDGIRYLHVRFKNSAGWGKTAHRKLKIDNTPPVILSAVSSITEEDLVALKIESQDTTSGINKYKISIDGTVVSEIGADGNPTKAILSPTKPGNHDVSVIAYDRAGNLSEKIVTIAFPEFKAPQIIKYPEAITKGEKIIISGISYPDTDVRIWVQNEGSDPKSYIVRTLADGTFTFESDFIDKTGLTSFYAEAMRSALVISPPSLKYFVTVNKTAFVKLSLLTIEILSVSIPVLLLLILLLYIAYHAYHKLKKMRRRLLADLEQTESESHKIFKIINEDIKQSIKILKKKEIKEKLTEDERKKIDSLSKDVEEAEEYFAKRIKSIEKKDL